MTHTKIKKLVVPILWVVLSGLSWAQESNLIQHPIAIDRHPRGDLYVLENNGAVTELSLQTGNKGSMRSIVPPNNRGNYGAQVVDIVAAAISKIETVFVSSTNDGRSKIQQLSLEGRIIRTFDLPLGGSGFDIDVDNHVLYIASSFGGEVFKVNLANGEVVSAFTIPGALSLGPLVISQGQRCIYVADQKTGTVYQVDMRAGRVSSLWRLEAQPVALAFDEQIQTLYVADAEQGRVYRIAERAKKPSVIETHLKSVTGVAPGPLGSIYVSDGDYGLIVNIAQNGSVIDTYPRSKGQR